MSNITLPSSKNRGQMLETLRVRLKLHKTLGVTDALSDILTESHEYVYGELDNGVPQESTLTVSPNASQYEFVTDEGVQVARGSVQEVWVGQGSTSRLPLSQGITHAMRSLNQTGEPSHYDTVIQRTDAGDEQMFEVWPIPSDVYTIYIKHNRTMTRFENATDKPSAPYRLVLLYAIAVGKAHYQQPDAQAAMTSFNQMLSREKFRQKEEKRYFTGVENTARKPYVVKNANGTFSQVWN